MWLILPIPTSFTALVIALICARPLLGNFDQAFQYIQEFTGFFTPGIVVIFVLGMFWKGTSTAGALAAAIGSAVLSLALKLGWPELPFIDRVGLVFLVCVALAVLLSFRWGPSTSADGRSTAASLQWPKPHPGSVNLKEVDFSTTQSFNMASVGVILILIALYATWW